MQNIEKEIVERLVLLRDTISKYELSKNINKEKSVEFKNIIENLEVGSRQYEIIHLVDNGKYNRISELAKFLDLSKSSLSLIISKMVAHDLIIKKYDTTSDSRNVILHVTESGENIYRVLKDIHCSALVSFLEELSQNQRELFDNAVESLIKTFSIFDIKPITKEHSNIEVADIIFENMFILKTPFEKFFREVKANIKDFLTLTEKEIKILAYLRKVETSTPTEISEYFKSSESTISLQLKGLLKTGHVIKTKCIMDSRKNLFSITDFGLETVNREIDVLQNELTNHVKLISEADKKNILDGLNNLLVLFKLLTEN